MPNTDGFHLYIHLNDLGDDSAVAGGGENNNKEEGDDSAQGIKSAVKKVVGYAAVKSTADQIISGQLQMVELRTGVSEYEDRLNAGYNIGKQIWGAGEAIVIGAAAGGLAGAIAGLAVSGIHQLIAYGQRKQTLALQEGLENVSIGFMNVRAGVDGRRNRNQ